MLVDGMPLGGWISRRTGRASGRPAVSGFTLLELVVVLGMVGIVLGIGLVGYRAHLENTATRRAAEVFVRDLGMARAAAVRERVPVSIVFDEGNRSYEVRTDEGRLIQARGFGPEGEIRLSGIALELDGSTVTFSARGFASLAGASGPLGVARFQAGGSEHEVRFNALGAARIEAP